METGVSAGNWVRTRQWRSDLILAKCADPSKHWRMESESTPWEHRGVANDRSATNRFCNLMIYEALWQRPTRREVCFMSVLPKKKCCLDKNED